jgi:hypothetical protein
MNGDAKPTVSSAYLIGDLDGKCKGWHMVVDLLHEITGEEGPLARGNENALQAVERIIRSLHPNLEGHDVPCYYCKEPCDSWAGNPSKWPVCLSHTDHPGKATWQHAGCVHERLLENNPPISVKKAEPASVNATKSDIANTVKHLVDFADAAKRCRDLPYRLPEAWEKYHSMFDEVIDKHIPEVEAFFQTAKFDTKAVCKHEEVDIGFDGNLCKKCGAFNTDSLWGIASNKWFFSRGEAEFYKKNGRMPSLSKDLNSNG